VTRNVVAEKVLLDGAQMTIAATIAGIAGFLKERSIPLKELVDYMGEAFDGSLSDLEGRGVDEVMEHLLTLQVLPMGAEVISSKSSPDKAEVTLTTMPPETLLEKFGTDPAELLEGFGITKEEYESIYAMYEPAAEAIGLRFEHHLKDGQEIISLQRT
jgi:hypothetical protein